MRGVCVLYRALVLLYFVYYAVLPPVMVPCKLNLEVIQSICEPMAPNSPNDDTHSPNSSESVSGNTKLSSHHSDCVHTHTHTHTLY